MILGDPEKWDEFAAAGIYGELTLDELLRRTARECGAQIAVAGADGGELTWSDLDAKIDVLADFLRDLGLKQDDPVLVLAGADAMSVAALLALSRAGMIAVPLSPVTGAREAADIAETLGARAIVAQSGIGPQATAEIAALAAFSAFNVRFLLGFGADLPDGVVSLDEVLAAPPASGEAKGALRGGRASDHVFALTRDGDGERRFFPARSHGQLIAASLPLVAHARLSSQSVIATPMVPCSLAGLCVLTAWLVSRARLQCLPAWSGEGIAENAIEAGATHLAVPGPLGAAADDAVTIRLWRDRVDDAAPPADSFVDAVSLGEAALAVWRGKTARNILPLSGLRLGEEAGPITVEPRVHGVAHKAGEAVEPGSLMRGPLAVRGPGTPVMAFPKDESGKAHFADNGFMLTGLRGELMEADGPAVRILGTAAQTLKTGQMALDLESIDKLYAGISGIEDAAAFALPHPLLGHVVAMAYTGPEELDLQVVTRELEALGVSAYKFPARLVRMAQIPRDEQGSLDRGALAGERLAS